MWIEGAAVTDPTAVATDVISSAGFLATPASAADTAARMTLKSEWD